MKWAALAKKILTSTETRTDATDERLIRSTFVSNGSAPFEAFPEKDESQRATFVVPAYVSGGLELGGYNGALTDWSPSACRVFLNALSEEHPGFRVNGRYGCQMPDEWLWSFRSAVMSIYVLSMQDSSSL